MTEEDINLTEEEAERLVKRLLNPPKNKRAKRFIKKSIKFYERMKEKERKWKEKHSK